MKIRPALMIMTALAALTAGAGFYLDRPTAALSCFAWSAMAILCVQSVGRVWKPWFLDAIEEPAGPDHLVFAVQSLAIEAIMIAALCAAAPTWSIVVARLIGFLVQLVSAGKLSGDVAPTSSPESDEIRRKSNPSARKSDAEQRRP